MAAERLAAVRAAAGGGPAAQQAVTAAARALEAAREAAVRQELGAFVEQALPRLAEVLSSRTLLLRCFAAAGEGGSGSEDD